LPRARFGLNGAKAKSRTNTLHHGSSVELADISFTFAEAVVVGVPGSSGSVPVTTGVDGSADSDELPVEVGRVRVGLVLVVVGSSGVFSVGFVDSLPVGVGFVGFSVADVIGVGSFFSLQSGGVPV